MASLPFYILDVFTQTPHGGNQLGVIVDLEDQLPVANMQAIARELGFAESTFIKEKTGTNTFKVRIFTPEYEVPFAGHPSLGTAFVIAAKLLEIPVDSVTLDLEKGHIPITISHPKLPWQSRFTMQQLQPDFFKTYGPSEISEGIGLPFAQIDTRWPIQEVNTGLPYLIIPLTDQRALQNLKFDPGKVRDFLLANRLHKSNHPLGLTTAFFFVTTETVEPENDFSTRMFCLENNVVVEDAATGSANGCFLAWLLRHQSAKVTSRVEQGFDMGRRSYIHIDGTVKNHHYQLFVGGHVYLVAQGTWA